MCLNMWVVPQIPMSLPRYMHRWELDAALDVLTMCSCHLPQSDPVRNEVLVFIVICFVFLDAGTCVLIPLRKVARYDFALLH